MWVHISILTVTSMAFDRFLSIYLSLNYILILTSFRLKIWCGAIWVLSFVLSISANLTYYDCRSNDIQGMDGRLCALYTLCCLVMLFSYVGIYRNIKMHLNKEKRLNMPSDLYIQMRFRAILKMSTIVLVFILCYTPTMMYLLIDIIDHDIWGRHNLYSLTSVALVFMNSFINPFLYVWRFKQCRSQVMSLLCFWNKTKVNDIKTKMKENIATFLV